MNKIIYLDAAASSLKPDGVIDAQVAFLRENYSNAGRGICARSAATDAMVARGRAVVADFMNATPEHIVFTSGTTDAMNRIAHMVRGKLAERIVVAVSDLDHHSARMPFAALSNADVIVMPLDSDFNIDVSRVPRADVMVITAMSNVLGRAQNVAGIIATARMKNPNVITVVDAAQYVAHAPIDVVAWDVDFVCWSAHKIGGDTGLGVMYIKNPNDFYPDKFGGGMVKKITGDEWILEPAPMGFEAGTLPLTQIAGLPAAIDAWRAWRGAGELIQYIYDELSKIPRIKILSARDASLVSFVVDGMHVLDVGAMLGAYNICVRVGNMCASWVHVALGVGGSVRISVGPWNTMDDARAVVHALEKTVK